VAEDNQDRSDAPPRRLSPVEQIRAMNQRRLAEAASDRPQPDPAPLPAPPARGSAGTADGLRDRPPSAPRVALPPPATPFGAEPPLPPQAAPPSPTHTARGPRPEVGGALQALREQTRGALGTPVTQIAPPPKATAGRATKRRDPWEAARERQRARRIAAQARAAEGPPRVHPGYFVFLIAAIVAAVLLIDRDFGEVEAGASLEQLADDFRPRVAALDTVPADEIPDSPAGEQLRWLVERLNDRGAPTSLSEIREHLDMGASLTVEVIDHDLQQNARDNAPYAVRAHVEKPSEHRLVMLFDTSGPHQQTIAISVSPAAPHGITALTITDFVEAADDAPEPVGP
jgi:hypothetical protein